MADEKKSFEEAAQEGRLSLVQEFLLFLSENKKWWLLPILIILALLAVLAVLSASGLAPFVYPML